VSIQRLWEKESRGGELRIKNEELRVEKRQGASF